MGSPTTRRRERVHTPHAYALVHYMPDDIIESWFETLFKKPVSIEKTIRKRRKRLWTLLTAEEVFDEHGWLWRWTMV